MRLCAATLACTMSAFRLTVDRISRPIEGTYAGAMGARATRHLAYAAHPVPTDQHYNCTLVDLEGRWDVLRDLAGAVNAEPSDELAIKLRKGVVRYCLSNGMFLECPDWELDNDVQRKLKHMEATLAATKAQYEKAKEETHARETAAQHKLQKLEAAKSQTCSTLRADVEKSTRRVAQLEEAQGKAAKAFADLQTAYDKCVQEQRTAKDQLVVAENLISRLKSDATQLEQRNRELQCSLDKRTESLRSANEQLSCYEARLQAAILHPEDGCKVLTPSTHEGISFLRVTHEGGQLVEAPHLATEFLVAKGDEGLELISASESNGCRHLTTSAKTGLYLSTSGVTWQIVSGRLMAGQITFSPCSKHYLRAGLKRDGGLLVDAATLHEAAHIDLVRSEGNKFVLAYFSPQMPLDACCEDSVMDSFQTEKPIYQTATEAQTRNREWATILFKQSASIMEACVASGAGDSERPEQLLLTILSALKTSKECQAQVSNLTQAQVNAERTSTHLSGELKSREAEIASLQELLNRARGEAALNRNNARSAHATYDARCREMAASAARHEAATSQAAGMAEKNALLEKWLADIRTMLGAAQAEVKACREREEKAAAALEANMRAYGMYVRDAMLRIFSHVLTGEAALGDQDVQLLALCDDQGRDGSRAVQAIMGGISPFLALEDNPQVVTFATGDEPASASFLLGLKTRFKALAARLGLVRT